MSIHRSIEFGDLSPDNPSPRETFEDIVRRGEAIVGEMRLLLATAWRAEHAARVGLPGPCSHAVARLEVDGARVGRRSGVRMNGSPVDVPDSTFVVLLRFVLAHQREPGAWSTKQSLGIMKGAWMPSRIRRAFRGLLPAGFKLVEADGRERFRLNPVVVVERVDTIALASHPDAVVRRLAAEWTQVQRDGGIVVDYETIPISDRHGPEKVLDGPDLRSRPSSDLSG